jgi:hypothetical protein
MVGRSSGLANSSNDLSPTNAFKGVLSSSAASSWNVNSQAKNSIQSLASTNLISLKDATSSNGYIYPKTYQSQSAQDQQQCVSLVRALANVGGTGSWKANQNMQISPYLLGNHPTIPAGTPIATFENGTYPGATGTMSSRRVDGITSNTSAHSAIFLDYATDRQGNRVGIKILSQSEGQPASVETKYFVTGNSSVDRSHPTIGYQYSAIQN